MLKVYLNELRKVKRQKTVRMIMLVGVLMPTFSFALCLHNGYRFRNLVGMNILLGNFLVAPFLFSIILVMLFSMEEQNDTLKTILVTAVPKSKILLSKIEVAFTFVLIFSIINCLYTFAGGIFLGMSSAFVLKALKALFITVIAAVCGTAPVLLVIVVFHSGIDITDFKNKFCENGTCFVMRAKDEIEHIFSELYSVPDCLQKPYFMLKVQELLLFLYMVDVKKEKQRELYTSPQVEIVREIHKRLISNLQERPTIEELSKEYLINTATLKDTFKGVYGQPIGAYMKEYRIKQAAVLLRQTQATIAEIANQVGYENQSKFATAFRDIFKIAPAEYRKQNSSDGGLP